MSSIGAIGASSTSVQSTSVSMDDFINILLTQLTYQDPLKPMDNEAFMAQLAQFTTLGQTQDLSSKVDALLSTQSSMQAIGLIGRTVQFTSDQGTQTGTVASLSWAGTTPQLSINVTGGTTVSDIGLSQVTVIR